MCYGYECEFYFVDELANEEFCLNQENCSQVYVSGKNIVFSNEGENDFGRSLY